MLPPALQERLSAKEVEYFAGYDRLLSKYMQHYPGLDLPGAVQVGRFLGLSLFGVYFEGGGVRWCVWCVLGVRGSRLCAGRRPAAAAAAWFLFGWCVGAGAWVPCP